MYELQIAEEGIFGIMNLKFDRLVFVVIVLFTIFCGFVLNQLVKEKMKSQKLNLEKLKSSEHIDKIQSGDFLTPVKEN